MPPKVTEKPKPTVRPLTEQERQVLRDTLGARVAAAREHLGLSQRALARAMGKSGSWIRSVEMGQQYAPSWLLASLAETTGWSVAWFYGFGARRDRDDG